MTIIIDDNGCGQTFHEMKKTDTGWTAKHADDSDCELVEFRIEKE